MMNPLDFSGAALSLLSTYYFTRENLLAWPAGLFAAAINLCLYLQKGIYADSCLEGFYVVLSVYGWYQWQYGNTGRTELSITHISNALALKLALIAITSSIVLSYCLSQYTNSTVPYLDATTTVLCLIAQWLTCKKIIESWFIWLTTDIMYLWLYSHKAIPFHVGLMIIYLGMAVLGYLLWQNSLQKGALLTQNT